MMNGDFMDKLYECAKSNKSKLENILNENPYEELSFAKNGYIMKDGAQYGFEGKVLLFISAEPEFFKFADEKLKDIGTAVPEDKAKPIVEQIKTEESAAEEGFGAIFG